MNIEMLLMLLVLIVGWPTLLLMTLLIVKRGIDFYHKLEGKLIGRLIVPTIFGWLFGMYSLGTVSTAYMFDLDWKITVLPVFALFMGAIVIIYRAISKWEKEAQEIQNFYEGLEKLVKKRTKELEKSHKKAIEHEKELQKLKDQFVFIAAHELKTPVTAIRWGIESALQEGKSTLDKDVMEYLHGVQSSNKRLITLVDDLLNVARIEAGTIKVAIGEVELKNLTKEVVSEMSPVFKEKGVKVTNEITKKVVVKADRDRLKQVMINLLSNATKYNKEKGKIRISMEQIKTRAKVSVSDTGIGMTQAETKKLFQKFFRAQNNDTKQVDGTGLGLFVTKEIIEKMKGKISVKSKRGEGSTFIFTLPITKRKKKK